MILKIRNALENASPNTYTIQEYRSNEFQSTGKLELFKNDLSSFSITIPDYL